MEEKHLHYGDKEQIKLPLYSSIWGPLFHHDIQDPNWHMFSSNLGLCWGLLQSCLYSVVVPWNMIQLKIYCLNMLLHTNNGSEQRQ